MRKHQLTADSIARFRVGDADVFREIVRTRYSRILFIAKAIVRDQDEAEDIVLITFYKLWAGRQGFDTMEHIDAFLLTTARNKATDRLRERQSRGKVYTEFRYLSTDADPSRESEIVWSEWTSELWALVGALSPKRREVMLLLYQQGMTVREVALRLGISPVTVQGHKSRALKKIKNALIRGGDMRDDGNDSRG